MYETYYVTAHKAPCRTASFSQNGKILFIFLVRMLVFSFFVLFYRSEAGYREQLVLLLFQTDVA